MEELDDLSTLEQGSRDRRKKHLVDELYGYVDSPPESLDEIEDKEKPDQLFFQLWVENHQDGLTLI